MAIQRDPEAIETRTIHEFASFANARVLEIGCGDGRLTWRYAASARQVVGIDPNIERVAAAVGNRSASMPASFLQGKAEALPFPDESFDTVILAWSL